MQGIAVAGILALGALLLRGSGSGDKPTDGPTKNDPVEPIEPKPECGVFVLDDEADWDVLQVGRSKCILVVYGVSNEKALAALNPGQCANIYIAQEPHFVFPTFEHPAARVYRLNGDHYELAQEQLLTGGASDIITLSLMQTACDAEGGDEQGFSAEPSPGFIYQIRKNDYLNGIAKRALPSNASDADVKKYAREIQRSMYNYVLYAAEPRGVYPTVTVDGKVATVQSAFLVANDDARARVDARKLPRRGVKFKRQAETGNIRFAGVWKPRQYGALAMPEIATDGRVIEHEQWAPGSLPMRTLAYIGIKNPREAIGALWEG